MICLKGWGIDMDEYILIFKALGDSTRLQIVQMLSGGEMCACKILERFQITQPTLSHHMKILCDCGLISARKEGKWSYYTINKDVLSGFQNFVASLESGGKGSCSCS